MSAAPLAFIQASMSDRVASAFVVNKIKRSPLRASGAAATAEDSSGHRPSQTDSTAASEIISPPILAKRFTRPTIVT